MQGIAVGRFSIRICGWQVSDWRATGSGHTSCAPPNLQWRRGAVSGVSIGLGPFCLEKCGLFPPGWCCGGFPRVCFFGRVYLHNFLILDQFGKSLEDLFNGCNRKFSLKTVLLLARQLLERFQFMHEKNYIHRDIKPENLLIGMPGTSSSNTRYMSINTHLGREQSRRDDLSAWAGQRTPMSNNPK
ncbi:Protein kinase-like domain containing protein [Rhypophila decipiens]